MLVTEQFDNHLQKVGLTQISGEIPSKTMIKHCKEFKENPPGENWGRVYTASSK
jgi:hypothetical protein